MDTQSMEPVIDRETELSPSSSTELLPSSTDPQLLSNSTLPKKKTAPIDQKFKGPKKRKRAQDSSLPLLSSKSHLKYIQPKPQNQSIFTQPVSISIPTYQIPSLIQQQFPLTMVQRAYHNLSLSSSSSLSSSKSRYTYILPKQENQSVIIQPTSFSMPNYQFPSSIQQQIPLTIIQSQPAYHNLSFPSSSSSSNSEDKYILPKQQGK